MKGQIDFEEYISHRKKVIPTCVDCVCESCLYHASSRCPYGRCYDDKRAAEEPYDKAHPQQSPRMSWSNWDKPGEQAHWCRGGIFYPVTYCRDFVKYQGCTVTECLKANVAVYQDGYIDCSLIENFGCEQCYKEFGEKY